MNCLARKDPLLAVGIQETLHAKTKFIMDSLEDAFARDWNEFLETTEKKYPWIVKNFLRKLTVNAPVLLLFCLICIMIHFVSYFYYLGNILGIHDTWNTFRPLQYTSLVTHIFAHSDFGHLRGNLTHLLLVGPSVEHTFGSKNLLTIIFAVAISSAFAHIMLGGYNTHQLGASGVVFACILLNSLSSAKHGKIPVSFLLTSLLYLGEEFVKFVFPKGHVSHHAHLVGGLVGAAAGFVILKRRHDTTTKTFLQKWMAKTKEKSK